MPQTVDRFPGASDEEGIILEDVGSDSTAAGEVRYYNGDFRLKDQYGTFNPRAGGALTESQHENLDTLVHEIAETSVVVVTRSANLTSNVTIWTLDPVLFPITAKKIRETQITRLSNLASTLTIIQYDAAGLPIVDQTTTKTITRSAGRVSQLNVV